MNLDQFDDLLDAYLLGEISEERSAQLQEALETDPAARQRFVQSILIETHLHRLARSEAASTMPRQPRPPEAGPHRLRRLAWAAVALVAVSAGVVFYFARPGSRTFARVVSGHVLVDGQTRDRIAEGSALSVQGPARAVIGLSDGSRATLDPGTQLTLRGRVESTRQVLDLTSGGGQFQVPHGGGQFRIDTPVGSVTVLGTQFTAVLRSPRGLFLSVEAGTVRFDGEGRTFTLSTGQSRTVGPEPDRPTQRRAADPRILDGFIRSVDLAAGTFVLGGRKETQTTFRPLQRAEGRREATHILLNGQKATFQTAIQPGRKASVTYVQVSENDLWVWKVEVTSAAK